ncbi:MAG: glutamine synthetase family protein [Eubacteriales bacterium]|nr:glutamine synthetase family protein [Eubacteriales bacterium]
MSNTVSDVLDFIDENDVKFVRLAFCDLFGHLKNVSIMHYQLDEAFRYGIHFDGSSIPGFRRVEHSDLVLKPDLDSLSVLPWRPQQGRVARFYCDIYKPDGSRYEGDPRAVLQKAVKHLEDVGFTCNMGEECEFYLFKLNDDGTPTNEPLDQGQYFDVAPLDKGENIRRDICLDLEKMGIYPEMSHHEAGPGQNEIVFQFADALTTADNLLTFKSVVRAIAARYGAWADFSPKPVVNHSGNGLHVNISLSNGDQNIFDTEDPELLKAARSFMAGVLKRVGESTLFLNSTRDSYKRLREQEAPSSVTWTREDRSQLLRLPYAMGERKRFELRSPDPCVDPYLAYALIIEAGLEGIEKGYDLPAESGGDTASTTPSYTENLPLSNINMDGGNRPEELPRTLEEAIKRAELSDFVRNVLGDDITRKFIDLKKVEIGLVK